VKRLGFSLWSGDRLGATHYRFASDLLWSVIFHEIPKVERELKGVELI